MVAASPPRLGASPRGADAPGERRRRASALPPEARRAAIAQATVRLVIEHGAAVTTRQIAEAAGIAEGTIFRVFADKDAVLDAALDAVLDPAPAESALAAIDPTAPFEDQLDAAVAILQQRLRDIWQVLSAVRTTKAPADGTDPDRRPPSPPELVALVGLFETHADQLRVAPATAARQLRALVLATSHPMLALDGPSEPGEVTSLFLDGTRRRPDSPSASRRSRAGRRPSESPC